jgi:hypothetical protein
MATKERFSISMDPEVRTAVKAHAEAMGLDVSAYVVSAVLSQMQEDQRVAARWSAVDAAIAETDAAAPAEQDGDAFSPEEVNAARAGIAQALAPASADAAA